MNLKTLALAASAALALTAGSAQAALITFNPLSAPGVAQTPAFGTLAPGGELGANYIDFGVDFTFGGVEGYFDDVPMEFCGINANNECDLLSDVDGRIVALGSLTQSTTNYFYAEAGYADPGSLTLSVFDINGDLISSVVNGDPLGTNGRTTFSVAAAGIASFRISGGDTYGVAESRLNTPGGIPEPATWALMIGGFGLAGASIRRRRALAA